MIRSAILCLFLCAALNVYLVHGYGEEVNSYPSYRERLAFATMIMARLDPVRYRNQYMNFYASDDHILEQYQWQNPMWQDNRLSQSARSYANNLINNNPNNCGGHTCFNSNIQSRECAQNYCCGGYGENIDGPGNCGTGLDTTNDLLCDGMGSIFGGTVVSDCAPDKSNSDEHRSNIMSPNHHAGGQGYADNGGSTSMYVTDFGDCNTGGYADPTTKIYSGTHFFWEGQTRFAVQFRDPNGNRPQSVSLIYSAGNWVSVSISNIATTNLGSADNAVWTWDLPRATSCRAYYFKIVDSSGNTLYYPTTGTLATTFEGSCTDTFYSSSGNSDRQGNTKNPSTTSVPSAYFMFDNKGNFQNGWSAGTYGSSVTYSITSFGNVQQAIKFQFSSPATVNNVLHVGLLNAPSNVNRGNQFYLSFWAASDTANMQYTVGFNGGVWITFTPSNSQWNRYRVQLSTLGVYDPSYLTIKTLLWGAVRGGGESLFLNYIQLIPTQATG